MYITARDRKILEYIRNNKSITINQCAKLFYTKNKEPYDQARKRLRILYNNKYIKRYRKDLQSECIYYMNKKLSLHDLKLYDVYAELVVAGATILEFERKYRVYLTKDKYREIDGLLVFKLDGYIYFWIIEVDLTHFTTDKKIIDIYNSNHFQEKFKKYAPNIFPTVIILKEIENTTTYILNKQIEIINTTTQPNIYKLLEG